MAMARDNWERLVAAVLDVEELRRLAYCSSLSSGSTSDDLSLRFSVDDSSDAVKELHRDINTISASQAHATTQMVLSEEENELECRKVIEKEVADANMRGKKVKGFGNAWSWRYKYTVIKKIMKSFEEMFGPGAYDTVYKRISDMGGIRVDSLHKSLVLKRYKYSDIKKITKSFNEVVGLGGSATVYKGTLSDGCDVAVKVLNETDSNEEEFINEAVSTSITSHVNVVNLLGFCHKNMKRALVYEFMPNKSLDMFVSKTSDENFQGLDVERQYRIAIGVAKGLEYLHTTSCNTKIVHFDIKPHNILLDNEFCPKITDFGFAHLFETVESTEWEVSLRGTIGYVAPEMFITKIREFPHNCVFSVTA